MDETSPSADEGASSRTLTPIMTIGGWNLVPGKDYERLTTRERALADLFAQLFPAAVAAAHKRHPLANDQIAYVTLGGPKDAEAWDMDEDALGFHAVCSQRRSDDDSDDSGDDYFDVNEHLEAVINVPALARAIEQDGGDDASVEASLVTMPHEMAHILGWLQASQGRTPLEVFDQDGGELALKRVLERVESQAHGRGANSGKHGHAEDEAESFGRDVVDEWVATTSGGPAWNAITAGRSALRRPRSARP